MTITAPFNLVATAVSIGEIDLTWGASTVAGAGVFGDIQQGDILSGDVLVDTTVPVVAGYQIYRNNVLVGTVGPVTVFSDTGLQSNTLYTYYVVGLDSASEISLPSNLASAMTLMGFGSLWDQLVASKPVNGILVIGIITGSEEYRAGKRGRKDEKAGLA